VAGQEAAAPGLRVGRGRHPLRAWCQAGARVPGPRVTAVQRRTGCGGVRADSADIGPEATPVGASVSPASGLMRQRPREPRARSLGARHLARAASSRLRWRRSRPPRATGARPIRCCVMARSARSALGGAVGLRAAANRVPTLVATPAAA
jgi:hypothetical protein